MYGLLALTDTILNFLETCRLPGANMRGQPYVCEYRTAGAKSGCRATGDCIQRHAPMVIYVRCASHRNIVPACKIQAFAWKH